MTPLPPAELAHRFNNEPPAISFIFTLKMTGSNNQFAWFHTDHLVRQR